MTTKKVWLQDGHKDGQCDPYVPLCFESDTKTRMAAFQLSLPVWRKSSLKPSLSHYYPALDLPKYGSGEKPIKHMCGAMRNFIPTKFHKHPTGGSLVKADYVRFPYINMH